MKIAFLLAYQTDVRTNSLTASRQKFLKFSLICAFRRFSFFRRFAVGHLNHQLSRQLETIPSVLVLTVLHSLS